MPITGRTARLCFDTFKDHLAELVSATVTERYALIGSLDSPTRMSVSFREGKPVTVPLDTKYGRLHFYVAQGLEAVKEGDGFRLSTRQYWYRLQAKPELTLQR